MLRGLGVAAVGFCLGVVAQADPRLGQAKEQFSLGQNEKALSLLEPKPGDKWSDEELALSHFFRGTILLKMDKPELAREQLEKTLVLKSNLSAYAFFQLGEAYFRLKRHGDAQSALERMAYFQPPAELKNQARYLLAQIAEDQGRWREAQRHFAHLERKWRRSSQYPEIIWRHLGVSLRQGQRQSACRLARKLYSQFPNHPLIYDWGFDLQNVRYQGERLGCMATAGDQSARIRRLQLAGLSDRALQEIDSVARSGRPADVERADMMRVGFLTSDGYPDQALQILLKYYTSHQSEASYQMNLARAAARAGEFQTAVGAYKKVYELSPSSRVGREALFQSAFMSYQFQDYDGATRQFEQLVRAFPRSGLAKDAHWHLAWMRYLRGDYPGAAELLGLLGGAPGKRSARVDERISYWQAMAFARMGMAEEARKEFEQIRSRSPYSYYALAAQARLHKLPAPQTLPEVVRVPAQEAATNSTATPIPPVEGGSELAGEEATAVGGEEGEDSDPLVDVTEGEPLDSDQDEKVEISDFKDPRLRRRFETARDLQTVGLTDWARHELYEIERRSRNSAYLKNLINAYEGLGSYHRAVSVSDSFFGSERISLGFEGARGLWESAYPQAYYNQVKKTSERFGLATEWIWSIMRAESHFKPDVMSPVGARGLMQIMPETGRQISRLLGNEESFQPMELLNPETNIHLGSRYLLRLSKKFKGNLPLVAAAYNAGPHRVDAWLANFGHLEMDEFIDHVPFTETRNYMKKVVRNFAAYRGLYAKDTRALVDLAEPVPVQVEGRPFPRETWDAD